MMLIDFPQIRLNDFGTAEIMIVFVEKQNSNTSKINWTLEHELDNVNEMHQVDELDGS